MPEFSSNLISVKKATNDLDCLVVFSPNDVQFQDIKSGKTIGDGSTKDSLCVLNKTSTVGTPYSALSSACLSYIWHAHLDHPHSKALSLAIPNLTHD